METPPTELWGVDTRVIPLAGGNRNKVFRTLGLDNDLVFKTTRRDPAAIGWLIPVFSLAEQSGFVVPWLIKSKNGQYVEQGWTCEAFIHGEEFRAEEMGLIGWQLFLFQEATRHVRQRPGFLSANELIQRDHGGDVDLRGMPSNIVALCREAWSRIKGKPVCVVHGDLNPSNLIHTATGRAAVLDWDECRVDAALFDSAQVGPNGSADKSIEMAVTAWEVACSWHFESDYANEIVAKLIRMANCP